MDSRKGKAEPFYRLFPTIECGTPIRTLKKLRTQEMGKRKHPFNTLYTLLFVRKLIELISDFVLEHNPTFEHVFTYRLKLDKKLVGLRNCAGVFRR